LRSFVLCSFFFSSRRRHTRCSRDWSSDVCSSDLVATGFTGAITVALGSNPGGATLSGTILVAAVGGVASFGDLSLNRTATGYTLTASAGGFAPVTSTAFDITPGTATQLAFTVQPSNTVAGAAISPAVQIT